MSRRHQHSHPGEKAAAGSSSNPIVLDPDDVQPANTKTSRKESSRVLLWIHAVAEALQAEGSRKDPQTPQPLTRKPFRIPHSNDTVNGSGQIEEGGEESDRLQRYTRRLFSLRPVPITEGSNSTEESEENLQQRPTKKPRRLADPMDSTGGSHREEQESEAEEYGGSQPLTEANLRRLDEQNLKADLKARELRRQARGGA